MTCASRTEIHQNLILKVDLLVKNWLENVTTTKLVLLKYFITGVPYFKKNDQNFLSAIVSVNTFLLKYIFDKFKTFSKKLLFCFTVFFIKVWSC